ncbi:hypothetical protein [Aestuariivivens sediminis]|nr:hypothetical protein [Aestuariivivens sediminis]
MRFKIEVLSTKRKHYTLHRAAFPLHDTNGFKSFKNDVPASQTNVHR